ncbi:odorant receptor isoform a [Lasius niger]|uniref:Odorant receptor isoform a n=1 Tax=Lasius niger TaxID=67767 RepID=A0A0J7NSB2_LASNI|nr:odorant receptor isoform a [Lasius niger]
MAKERGTIEPNFHLRVIVLLCRQKRIQTLLDIANGPAFSRHDKKYQDLLMRYTWKGIFHHAAYQSFGAIAVFCWGITPITDLIAGRSRQLPMEGWYPYNVTRTPVFEITAAHQGIAIIIACFHNVALDTLVTGLITVACCQLAILERNIISIDNEKSMQSDKDQSFNLVEGKILSYRQLKQCAVHSNMIFLLHVLGLNVICCAADEGLYPSGANWLGDIHVLHDVPDIHLLLARYYGCPIQFLQYFKVLLSNDEFINIKFCSYIMFP